MSQSTRIMLGAVLGHLAASGLTLRIADRPDASYTANMPKNIDVERIAKAGAKRQRKAAKRLRDNGNNRTS